MEEAHRKRWVKGYQWKDPEWHNCLQQCAQFGSSDQSSPSESCGKEDPSHELQWARWDSCTRKPCFAAVWIFLLTTRLSTRLSSSSKCYFTFHFSSVLEIIIMFCTELTKWSFPFFSFLFFIFILIKVIVLFIFNSFFKFKQFLKFKYIF